MAEATGKIQASTPDRLGAWLPTSAVALVAAVLLPVADGAWARLPDMVLALLTAIPWAVAWMLSAAGLGRSAARRLGLHGPTASCAIGAGLMMGLDQWAGSAGLLSRGLLPALALLTPGWWLLSRAATWRGDARMPWAVAIPIGLACGTMLVAASVPTGFLWSTEFGGYDALSYHLQLPREWIVCGSIRPLPHVAYSGLPNFLEGAFMHLMALRQDPRDAAVACQLLHAAMMVTAACLLGRVATRAAGSTVAGGAAVAAALGTPWLMATGSLPYSESGVMLGAAVMLMATQVQGRWRPGMVLGLGAAVAIGSKASSALLVVPGAGLAWLVLCDPRALARAALAAPATAVALLTPWALRNALHTGDPFFPLGGATTEGWWTAAQAARWAAAHASDEGLAERLHALWQQGPAFGWGDPPLPGEPWRPFWGGWPVVGPAAIAVMLRRPDQRRWALACTLMVTATVTAWLSATHLQSRFLLPVVAPLSIAAGVAAATLATDHFRRLTLALLGTAWGLFAVSACLRDFNGGLALAGQQAIASGDAEVAVLEGVEGDDAADEVRSHPSPQATLGSLFPGQRTLAVGWSIPFWVRPDEPVHWSTVWDTNPLERAMREPDPRAWLGDRYELVLVDWPMLRRWQRSGWLSPDLRPERVASLLQGLDRMPLAAGREIVSLRGPVRPTWPKRRPRVATDSDILGR